MGDVTRDMIAMRHRRHTSMSAVEAESLRARLKSGALFGAFFAAAGLAVGLLRGFTSWIAGGVSTFPAKTLLVVPVYAGSLIVVGAIGGALWPMRRTWLGRIALALLLGFLFFVAPMLLVFGDLRRWGHDEWWVYRACGLTLAGIIWWVFLRDHHGPTLPADQ